jgi:hypothetical protein
MLWIIDAALALQTIAPALDVLPCWFLRRKFAGTTQPVPDLLALDRTGTRALAIEIDLGGENIRRVLAPKLRVLDEALVSWGATNDRRIIVLLSSERRVESLQKAIDGDARIHALVLPSDVGRLAIQSLEALLAV